MCFIPIYVICPALSAAAKKAASSSAEVSGDKGDGEEGEKEGVNGEVEGESNGKVREEGAACGSKLRTCRRAGAGEASGAGKRLLVAQVCSVGGCVGVTQHDISVLPDNILSFS